MLRASRLALVLATLALPATGVAGGKAVNMYAAIAYSPSTGAFGTAHKQNNRAAAEKLALENCGAADARIVVWVRDGWCALAVSKRVPAAYGVGFAVKQADAERIALQECSKTVKDATGAISIFSEK